MYCISPTSVCRSLSFGQMYGPLWDVQQVHHHIDREPGVPLAHCVRSTRPTLSTPSAALCYSSLNSDLSPFQNYVDCVVHVIFCAIFIVWLFFSFFLYFNWRLITLQYCDGFCHTSTWISPRCTCIPPCWTPLPTPSPPHPSELSQSLGFECPVLCTKLSLVIYFTYGNIHVSKLFSHIVTPSPSPTESKSLFFMAYSYHPA